MNDSNESSCGTARWLVLMTEVSSRPDYLRVKLRRKVQRIGAIGLKGAVYLLPQSPDTLERFQVLRRELVADGGDATICVARFIEGMRDADLTDRFNAERDEEYEGFRSECASLGKRWLHADSAGRAALIAERARLFSRLEGILGRDFFTAPRREEAMLAVERLAVLDITQPVATRSLNP